MSTQTQILAERAVQLGFTDAPAFIEAVSSRLGHDEPRVRRVPARGEGPLRLTLIPHVTHLDELGHLDLELGLSLGLPLDWIQRDSDDWARAFGDGVWVRASSKCHPAKTDRGEQSCAVRCVQLMELFITITHAESGLSISAAHPYDERGKGRSLRPIADADGVEVSERVRQRLLASGIDWACDPVMLPRSLAHGYAITAWESEIPKLLKAERKRAAAWRETLGALPWPKGDPGEKIREAERARFFWREFRR